MGDPVPLLGNTVPALPIGFERHGRRPSTIEGSPPPQAYPRSSTRAIRTTRCPPLLMLATHITEVVVSEECVGEVDGLGRDDGRRAVGDNPPHYRIIGIGHPHGS